MSSAAFAVPLCPMKRIVFLFLVLLSVPVVADNIVRQAKDALKTTQKRAQLENLSKQLLTEALKPETRHKKRIECYLLAAECNKAINAAENEKLYLKKPYDTVVFFSSIRDFFLLVEKADSVTAEPNEKGRVNLSSRRHYRDMLMPYRSNLLTGGNWHYQHGQTRTAYDYFDTYIDAASHPIFAPDSFLVKEPQLPMTAYLAVFSAQKEGLVDGVIKHAPLAMLAGQRSDLVQEYYTRAWESKGDTAQWLTALKDGITHHANNLFFFTHLLNYYTNTAQWDKGLALSDSMAVAADTVPLFWYAKSLMLLRLNRDREALDACDACIKLAPDHADALYNKGIALLNIAKAYSSKACTDIKNPQYLRDQQILNSIYLLAKQPMERVRKLQPDQIVRWAPSLYRIYLHLNMGKEFDEMDHLLKKVVD